MREQSAKRDLITPAWVTMDGPSDDVAISTRARLARNIQGSPFPTRASEADQKHVADIVLDAIHRVDNGVDILRVIYPSHLNDVERLALMNSRLASRQQVNGGRYSPIVLNETGTLSVMVNEEDHLRIQCILPGFQPIAALERAENFDNSINSNVIYACADNYGCLTSSLANIGTGLRLSVMLHLGGLAYLYEDVDVLTAAAQLHISVRGLFGEGTKAFGDIYQVSNETTLGFSTREIASRVRAVAEHLISREREARKRLASERKEELSDVVERVQAGLATTSALSGRDAMAYLSILRLGAEIGVYDKLSARMFNKLLFAIQLGASDTGGSALDGAGSLSSDIKRARMVREMLELDGKALRGHL